MHQAHLITASKDNVPTPIRVNKTYKKHPTENRHMSTRTPASVLLKYKRVLRNWERLRSTNCKDKGPCERSEQTRHEMEHCRPTCSVRLPAPPQPSTNCRNECLFTREKKQQIEQNQCKCLARLQGAPPPALLFLRCTHSEMMSSASVQHLFVPTHKQLVL